MGLAGGFGAVGLGTVPVVGIGAVGGAAAYGAFKAIAKGDAAAFGAMGIGVVGAAGFSSVVGGMGLVAPKIGLAFGIGTVPMVGVGAVAGIAAYGIAKLLDESEIRETSAQVLERMEEKVLQMDYYAAAVMELEAFLSGEHLNQKFAALEVEDEFQVLKAELKQKLEPNCEKFVNSEASTPKSETKIVPVKIQPPENWKCVHTLKGHLAAVNAIAISPDGNIFTTGSDDRQVHLWNLTTGKWLYTFSGQAEAVLSVAISPDGQKIISGSVDRKISSWQIVTKKFLQTYFYLNSPYSHNGFIHSVAFSPDGKYVVSGSGDKTIRIWGGYTGTVKCTLNGHSDAVLSVTVSSDGKTIASASADKTIRLWDVNTWKQRCILSKHLGAVNTVVISPDSQTLISGSTDTTIKLWNLNTGELLLTLTGHSTAVLSVSITTDGNTLASSSSDGIIKIWNVQTGELIQTLSGRSPVAFSPDGKTLLSGGNNGTTKIWHQTQSFHNLTLDTILSGQWWEVLGIDRHAHPKDVKLAYRRLARLYHPDVNPSGSAKASTQAVNQAYQKFQEQLNADKWSKLH
ncbi:MAG: DnaJ domain-containing protein [Mojavia pulchra JT2-VF2]|uniref:DnaJ domain-containing protein n=1 Tax=Mojavia pulchra JT2-VF2 TaxID=287848 RepID=A0A951Q343_9NOST|nr:DnaJ domain-containing protein [Mojavia pulchra JT2-VF2]